MTRFRVFEPAGAEGPGEDACFVRDRFGWFAFLLPLVWLLRHRLFLAAAAVLALGLLLPLVLHATPAGWTVPYLTLLVGLVTALEGPAWRARRLEKLGWRETGTITADRLTDAEAIYFAGKSNEVPPPIPDRIVPVTSTAPSSLRSRPNRTLFDPPGA